MNRKTPGPTLASADLKRVLKHITVRPGGRFRLSDHDCAWAKGKLLRTLEEDEIKERAKEIIKDNVDELADAQDLLHASDSHAVLVVIQAMDAAGKDGTIRHVTQGLNPAGCGVVSFKAPTPEELDHTFLWRVQKAVPERGRIVIFNRSHYEDVLVVRVRPELLDKRKLATDAPTGKKLWAQRYEDINAFERHLAGNGTLILKFFLHVSKQEQRKRLLERLEDRQKNWKFNIDDLDARDRWDDYMRAYQDAIAATSTPWAPWFVIPADHKWVMRAMVAAVMSNAIRSLPLKYPSLSARQKQELARAQKKLKQDA
jgi:PPK2 family polyphosphate:nucleotide phosphotransferase